MYTLDENSVFFFLNCVKEQADRGTLLSCKNETDLKCGTYLQMFRDIYTFPCCMHAISKLQASSYLNPSEM